MKEIINRFISIAYSKILFNKTNFKTKEIFSKLEDKIKRYIK